MEEETEEEVIEFWSNKNKFNFFLLDTYNKVSNPPMQKKLISTQMLSQSIKIIMDLQAYFHTMLENAKTELNEGAYINFAKILKDQYKNIDTNLVLTLDDEQQLVIGLYKDKGYTELIIDKIKYDKCDDEDCPHSHLSEVHISGDGDDEEQEAADLNVWIKVVDDAELEFSTLVKFIWATGANRISIQGMVLDVVDFAKRLSLVRMPTSTPHIQKIDRIRFSICSAMDNLLRTFLKSGRFELHITP